VVEEPEVDVDDVADVDEVAALFAVAVAIAAFEEFDVLAGGDLVVEVEGDARHAAFVLFARAIHVEVAQADDLAFMFGEEAAGVLVEQELGVAVHVERGFVGTFFAEDMAGAVHGGRRRVDERNAAWQAEVQ